MSSPMQPLMRFGHRPHVIDRRRYGTPYFGLYWAGRRFAKPGLYLLALQRQWRLVPVRLKGSS